jgi:hypothetical protein
MVSVAVEEGPASLTGGSTGLGMVLCMGRTQAEVVGETSSAAAS